jgi:hypothetical protein
MCVLCLVSYLVEPETSFRLKCFLEPARSNMIYVKFPRLFISPVQIFQRLVNFISSKGCYKHWPLVYISLESVPVWRYGCRKTCVFLKCPTSFNFPLSNLDN